MINAELIQQFCAKPSDKRVFLQTMFQHDGKTYASNGHVGLIIHSILDGAAPATDQHANSIKVLTNIYAGESVENFGGFAEFHPLPKFDFPKDRIKRCPVCAGSGSVIKCTTCKGEGWFEHDNHKYDCKSCDANGYRPHRESNKESAIACDNCDGLGKIQSTTYAAIINDLSFDANYIELISQLPDVQIALGISANGNQSAPPPSIFKFIGGVGVIMPFRTDTSYTGKKLYPVQGKQVSPT